MEKYLEQAKVFKALGDPKRARIVDMLSYGELCACMILKEFKMSQPTLSHHMKLLCECGLVRGRQRGKWIYYSLDANIVGMTKQFFRDVISDRENSVYRADAICCEESAENE